MNKNKHDGIGNQLTRKDYMEIIWAFMVIIIIIATIFFGGKKLIEIASTGEVESRNEFFLKK